MNHFNVFQAVPLDSSISYPDLASKTKLAEGTLRRIIRHAMTNRMFYEPSPDHVAHTAMSAAPVKDPSMKAIIAHCIEESGASSTKQVEALDRYGESQDPRKAAATLAFDTKGGNIFDFFENDGEGEMKGWRGRRFAEAMRSTTTQRGHQGTAVHEGFDWQSLVEGTVVDVCHGCPCSIPRRTMVSI